MSEDRVLAAVTALGTDMTAIRTDLATIHGDIASIHGDIASIRGDIASIHGGIASIHGDIASIHGDIASIRGEVTTLRVDLMGRMDRFEDKLTALRDDIGVNMGRADRAHEAADHTRDELRLLSQEVSAMYRKMTRLEARMDARDAG